MSNTVVSSRIRFARNLVGVPFGNKLTAEGAQYVTEQVVAAVERLPVQFAMYPMSDVSDLDAMLLHEKHLISEALIANRSFGTALISVDEQITIMVNEEDHIRAQCILPQMRLQQAYDTLLRLDNDLGASLQYAVNPQLGYLTSCITNVGTAMRASAMMFLPGLTITNSIERNISIANNFKIAIRGVYGEGSRSEGYLYQISNQQTLGLSETEIIANITNVINHLQNAELAARDHLFRANEPKLRDEIGRAYGILTHAYVLPRSEFVKYWALLRLGAGLGVLDVSEASLDRLLGEGQAARIQSLCGKEHPDIFRAKHISKALKQ